VHVCRWLAVLLIPTLILTGATAAAGEPGSSDSGSDGNVDAIIALGAVALITGILVFDILSDGDQDTTVPAGDEIPVVPTGVDWSSVDPVEQGELLLVVASGGAPVESGELLDRLEHMAPAAYRVFPDVVELGEAGGEAAFELASSFFEADIVVVVGTGGMLEILGREGSVYSGPAGDMEGVLAALESEAAR
jgi:hypothetical protein